MEKVKSHLNKQSAGNKLQNTTSDLLVTFALTETGNTRPGNDKNWWTKTLYPGIKNSGISWVLLWRNARLDHYFSVYRDDISAEDFKEFAGYKETLFLNKVKNINSKKTY